VINQGLLGKAISVFTDFLPIFRKRGLSFHSSTSHGVLFQPQSTSCLGTVFLFRHIISRNTMLENDQETLYNGIIKGLMKVASGERLKSGFHGLM